MLTCRSVAVPPDAPGIARLLEASGEPHVALLHASERSSDPLARWSFVASCADLESRRLDPLADDDREPVVGEDEVDARVGLPALFGRVPRWIGVLPYESRRALERPAWVAPDRRPPALIERPEWRRYRCVACIDHVEGRVFAVGLTRADADRLAALLVRGAASGRASLGLSSAFGSTAGRLAVETADAEPLSLHIERIVAAKELIARGDLYQVNLARRIRVALREGEPLSLYERLARAAPTPFGAYIRLAGGVTVLSTSPELFLHACAYVHESSSDPLRTVHPLPRSDPPRSDPPRLGPPRLGPPRLGPPRLGPPQLDPPRLGPPRLGLPRFGALLTVPIKGTRPRGADAEADDALARELDADPKERAELVMIVDVERNDLGRVAEIGSVRMVQPPHVVTHRTVHHRQAVITARARPDVSREDVLLAMLPSGSVTGAPKIRAMEVIAGLEPCRRGLYTGAFGYVGHDGGMTLAMGIRTVVLAGREGEYLTGGGIVSDSDPERELEETRWKALQLERAARG